MKRRYGLLALAVLALLLLNLSWQEAPTRPAHTGQLAQPAAAASPQTQPAQARASGPVAATTVPAGPAPAPASWRELPDEMNRQLASEVSDSEQPLAERLANLEAIEAQWLSEGRACFGCRALRPGTRAAGAGARATAAGRATGRPHPLAG